MDSREQIEAIADKLRQQDERNLGHAHFEWEELHEVVQAAYLNRATELLALIAPDDEQIKQTEPWLKVSEVVAWGDAACPHVHRVFATRPRRACDICWEEFTKEVKP